MTANITTKKNVLASCLLIGACSSMSVNALEIGANLHQGEESDTKGASFHLANSFTKGSQFYWSIGYSVLDDVKATWNGQEKFFKVDNVDAIVSYRHTLKSYNSFLKKVTFEYQVGATMALTDNLFDFPNNPEFEEVYLSESNDVNAMIGLVAHYKLTKNASINLGLRHQPSYSDFDDISSAYIGFSYRFGNGL